ncbi:relaxase/mobilization nuclease domain-containing protein [Dorea sp. Marseille-P4042]|uniref:relaxase/mobilization nuclease domain-containing protein n=1 Tax=Dorea sp. Marseille-P4042 TaxID=2080749 RepID=UPI000CF88E0D|nr:relaxase/mobilization nuclease domain-containing protein [Dorea sp. Marseille-P4042]
MATTRIMPLHVGKGRTESRAISDIIDYVANPQKTDNGKLITGYGCDSRTADAEFAKRFTKGNHAFVVCTHIDKSHIHNHIIWSSVSLEYDRKFRNFWGSTKAVRRLSDTICIENGLSIVENPKLHGKSYNKWLGDQAKPSHREMLRVAIDNALSQSPDDFEELLKLLQEYGCEVSKRGKSYRLKLSGWEKAHTPRKKTVTQAETPKINLLVDIQAKLQAGKGVGYARWAKVFNLKQMAQTMNYLSENNLLEYAVLEEKAAAATAHHNDLSAQIKAAEKRMAEIAVLRTHIVNYAKTREIYVAYRKAGYSKKFREEHEEEILLHQAAKNAFDEMGVKKLPKVKELQTEYAKLLEEKKKTYSEYRRSREEMRELLTAKVNVDRVLKMEVEQDVEKEKDHGQR